MVMMSWCVTVVRFASVPRGRALDRPRINTFEWCVYRSPSHSLSDNHGVYPFLFARRLLPLVWLSSRYAVDAREAHLINERPLPEGGDGAQAPALPAGLYPSGTHQPRRRGEEELPRWRGDEVLDAGDTIRQQARERS